MRLPFLNKARKPEQTQQIDPRARLAALVEYRHDALMTAETKYVAGIIDAETFERAKADLNEAEHALADFDAQQEQATADAARRAEVGAARLREAQDADSEMAAAADAFDRARGKALAVAETIERDFRVFGGYAGPFAGSPIVERLKFWSNGVNVWSARGQEEVGRFEERLAAYRRILQPPVPVVIHRPTPESKYEKEKRRKLALESSRLRLRPLPGGGVEVVMRPENQAG